jgi:hypothetical protein
LKSEISNLSVAALLFQFNLGAKIKRAEHGFSLCEIAIDGLASQNRAHEFCRGQAASV